VPASVDSAGKADKSVVIVSIRLIVTCAFVVGASSTMLARPFELLRHERRAVLLIQDALQTFKLAVLPEAAPGISGAGRRGNPRDPIPS
jgi:hypothetical protein